MILSNSSTLCIPKSHFNIALILNNVIQNTVYKQTSDSSLFGLDQHHCTDQDILQTTDYRAYESTADWLRSDEISCPRRKYTSSSHYQWKSSVVTLKCKWNRYSNVHICSFVDCLQNAVRVKMGVWQHQITLRSLLSIPYKYRCRLERGVGVPACRYWLGGVMLTYMNMKWSLFAFDVFV